MHRGARAGPRGPNILFIFTDDHGAQAISAYGSKINETPNIDRLANEGLLFRYAFRHELDLRTEPCGHPFGKYSHSNGQLTNVETFDGSQQNVFRKLLQQAGYQDGVVSGSGISRASRRDFDAWQVLIGQGPYYNPPIKSAAGVTEHVGYTTNIITDLALDWLKSGRDAQKPFMMMYQHKAPHRRWDPGPDHLTMYDDVEIPEPDTFFDDYAGRGTAATQQTMSIARNLTERDLKLVPPEKLTAEQLEVWNAAYEPKNDAFPSCRSTRATDPRALESISTTSRTT